MNDLIERVAKAIRDSDCGTGSQEPWQEYIDDARAAVRAVRESIEAAIAAAKIEIERQAVEHGAYISSWDQFIYRDAEDDPIEDPNICVYDGKLDAKGLAIAILLPDLPEEKP